MSADWCKQIDDRLGVIETRLLAMEASSAQLTKIVVLGLLAIVGAVVGVKVIQ